MSIAADSVHNAKGPHACFLIGIDSHKGSALPLDPAEAVTDTIRVEAIVINADACWPAVPSIRARAVDGATGMGALLAQQLVASAESVVVVPP